MAKKHSCPAGQQRFLAGPLAFIKREDCSMKSILYILIPLFLIGCDSRTSKIKEMEGIWTSYESIHSNKVHHVLAFNDTNMYWYSGFMHEMVPLSYRIQNDTLFMFDQMNGKWMPSFHLPGRIEVINDSIFWLSSTPQEALVFERSLKQMDQAVFDSLTISDIQKLELPFYRK